MTKINQVVCYYGEQSMKDVYVGGEKLVKDKKYHFKERGMSAN